MSKPSFVYVTFIRTTPEKVWAALTTPEVSRKFWNGHAIIAENRVGGEFRMERDGDLIVAGEVLECEPPRRLAYSFKATYAQVAHEAPSHVLYEIEQDKDRVKLTVTHDGFEQGSQTFEMIRNGWPAAMSSLKSLLETGKGLEHFADCAAQNVKEHA